MAIPFVSNIADALKKRPTFPESISTTPPFNPNEMASMPSAGGLPGLATGAAAPAIAPPAMAAPALDLSGQGVPIPQLPGRSGGPRPFDEMEKAKYDYVSQGMRDKEGNLGNKVRRSWKDIAMNALVGGLKGASASPENPLAAMLGGAAVGGVGTAIDPTAGREFRFDTTMRPGIEADMARQREGEDREYQKRKRSLDLEEIISGIAGRNATTDATRASMKDTEMERKYRQSQVDLNQARQEAVLKGKPIVKDLVDDDGAVQTYQVFPDGTRIPVGGSAANAMLGQRLETRKDIASKANQTRERISTGANAARANIETMKESGRNTRSDAKAARKPDSPARGTTVSAELVRQFAREKGISESEALSRFKAKGLSVQ